MPGTTSGALRAVHEVARRRRARVGLGAVAAAGAAAEADGAERADADGVVAVAAAAGAVADLVESRGRSRRGAACLAGRQDLVGAVAERGVAAEDRADVRAFARRAKGRGCRRSARDACAAAIAFSRDTGPGSLSWPVRSVAVGLPMRARLVPRPRGPAAALALGRAEHRRRRRRLAAARARSARSDLLAHDGRARATAGDGRDGVDEEQERRDDERDAAEIDLARPVDAARHRLAARCRARWRRRTVAPPALTHARVPATSLCARLERRRCAVDRVSAADMPRATASTKSPASSTCTSAKRGSGTALAATANVARGSGPMVYARGGAKLPRDRARATAPTCPRPGRRRRARRRARPSATPR